MNNNCDCCPTLIPTAVATVTEGATIAVAVSQPTTAPVYGNCYKFTIPAGLTANTGQELTNISIGGVTGTLLDNPRCKRTVPSQMLGCPNCCRVYTVQFAVDGTTNIFYAIRGFAPRRTTTVAPAASA